MNATDVVAFRPARVHASCSIADNRSASWWRSLFGGSRLALAGRPGRPAFEREAAWHDSDRSLPGAKVLDLTHDAICVRSLDGVIQYWNHAAERLYGWKADEAIGRVSHTLFSTVFPTPLDSIEAEVMRAGCWDGELVHMRKDRSRVMVASRWSLVRDEASVPIAIVESNLDITERMELEERLRRAEKMEAIGCFASGIAHDFSNVLGGILAYGEMLYDDAPDDAPCKRYAQNVLTAATRGRELVDQILAYTRSQRGKRSATDVGRTVAETLELVQSALPARITVHATIPDAPAVVFGNVTQLHQVVMNLCSNAIQAMKAGGALRVAVNIVDVGADRALLRGTLRPGRYVGVSVDDDGCGMDEATLARIFEPFFTTKDVGSGTGLGLALVNAIVTSFDGAIDVKTAPGQGSTFAVYLPLADDQLIAAMA